MGYDIEKEKREAIEAGRRALNSLQTAKENLNSAKNWGLVDMFGGGFFTTMLKHSKMDQAKQNMEQAKYDLRNFSRELNDVNMACNLNIDTGDFLSFADYFFDGFVVDCIRISSRIMAIAIPAVICCKVTRFARSAAAATNGCNITPRIFPRASTTPI